MQMQPQASHLLKKVLLTGLQEEIFMNGTIVLPHKEIKESQHDPGTIIM